MSEKQKTNFEKWKENTLDEQWARQILSRACNFCPVYSKCFARPFGKICERKFLDWANAPAKEVENENS